MGERLRWLAATSGGLGCSPVASGTTGSLGGVVLAAVAQLLAPPGALALAWTVLGLLLLAGGIALGPWAQARFASSDPGPFVLDEVAGYVLAVAVLAWLGSPPGVLAHAAVFVAFRAADVLKPWPAGALERLPGGWGIMLDDVAAGLYAGLVVALLRGSWMPWA